MFLWDNPYREDSRQHIWFGFEAFCILQPVATIMTHADENTNLFIPKFEASVTPQANICLPSCTTQREEWEM